MKKQLAGPIRLGVIGAGSAFERLHWPVLARMPRLFRVHSVTSGTPERAQAAAVMTGAHVADDAGKILADPDIDAVLIAVPIEINHTILIKAIGSGKHVLAEKPIAATPEQARTILEQLPSGKIIAIGENFRYRKNLALARKLLADGICGEILTFQLRVAFDLSSGARTVWTSKEWRREPRYPGGFLLDTGVHAVAFLRDLLGEVEEVFARRIGHNPALGGSEGLMMDLRLRNDVPGQYFACYSAKLERESGLDITVFGRTGTMEITSGLVTWTHGPGLPGGSRRFSKSDLGYEAQWRNFSDAIRQKAPLISTPLEAYRDLLVIDAALRSADTGQPTRIE